jgi:hypothetical protein
MEVFKPCFVRGVLFRLGQGQYEYIYSFGLDVLVRIFERGVEWFQKVW